MKCLLVAAFFGLIAIVSAGTQRLDDVNHLLMHRIARQTQSFSSSSSSSSSSGQPGQPIVFHQTSSSFNSFAPGSGNAGNAATATNNSPNIVPNLLDRFGPEDSADNNGSTASTSQNAQSDNTQAGNIPYAGVPYGNGQFPGAGQFGNGPFGTGPFGNAPFGNVPNYGNVPIHSGGHFSSVAGQYDPNTQQTVIYHNYNQKLK